MGFNKAVKAPATLPDHIDRLRSRGMDVDEHLAAQWLTNVSYYRLSAYWYPARVFDANGERLENYRDDTSFSDVVALYEADRKLRTLIHDGIERIEVAMRTRVGELLVFSDPLFYKSSEFFRDGFDQAAWQKTVDKRISRAFNSKNSAIRHYHSNYEQYYPFWVLAEVLDFADISKLFAGLKTADQQRIAEDLGFRVEISDLTKNQREKLKKRNPLAVWLQQLTIIRNTCAHHGRLWNKSFVPAPTTAFRTQAGFEYLPVGQSERIYGALIIMAHILNITSPGTSWPEKVNLLLDDSFLSNPLVDHRSLGIPKNEWSSGAAKLPTSA